MVNEREVIQQVPVEGGISSLTAEQIRVEREGEIQPAVQAPTNGIQSLETHRVGPQIQTALNDNKIGKDFPEISDISDSSQWRRLVAFKATHRGEELPS